MSQGTRKAGRPVVHQEAWSKITVVMMDRQVEFLDRLSESIRDKSGKSINRAQIIRALVDFVDRSGIDLSEAKSEEEILAGLLRSYQAGIAT
jgi:hypothetical protein